MIIEEKQLVFTNVVEERIPVGSPANTERTWKSVKFFRPRGKTYLILDTFEIYFIFCSKINRSCQNLTARKQVSIQVLLYIAVHVVTLLKTRVGF